MKKEQDLKVLDQEFSNFQTYLNDIQNQMDSTFSFRYSTIQNFTSNIENTIVSIRQSKIEQEKEIAELQEQIIQAQLWIKTKRSSIQLKKEEIKHCQVINQALQKRIQNFKKQQERLYQLINQNKSHFDKENSMKNNLNIGNNGRKSILVKKNAMKNSKKQQNTYKNVEFDLENNKVLLKFKNTLGQQHFMQLHYNQKQDKFLLSNSRKNIEYLKKLQQLIQEFNTHQNLRQLFSLFVQVANDSQIS